MLYLLNIQWTRRIPDPDREPAGNTVYAIRSKYLSRARVKARLQFLRELGGRCQIDDITEVEDPARIYQP